jgi:signal transduction histidine kinase
MDSWVTVSVSDNGCGISKEFMEKDLFHPFKTTKKQGMGIGLFQSKMIVEAHQGRIEVESEPGVGTTFKVMLPLRRSSV